MVNHVYKMNLKDFNMSHNLVVRKQSNTGVCLRESALKSEDLPLPVSTDTHQLNDLA